MPFRELAGAFVVDSSAGPVEPDRVIVITEWTSLTPRQLGQILTANVPPEVFVGLDPRLTFVMNGLRGTAWLDVRTPGGNWQVQGHVIVRQVSCDTYWHVAVPHFATFRAPAVLSR